jgi:hypothetical protein
MAWHCVLRSSPPDPAALCRRPRVALWQRTPAGHDHTREPTACLTCRRRARLGCSVPPNALSWGSTALWLVRVRRIREDYTMSCHLLGDLVTRALLAVPLSPLAQPPAQVPRRGYLVQAACSHNSALLEACRPRLRDLGWVEGHQSAMPSRSGVRRMQRPQAASPLALGWAPHPADIPAVHTRRCDTLAPWRKRQRRTYGGDWAKRVASTQHHGRRDDASCLARLAHHHAGPQAILVPPAVSPGGRPLTADTRPGIGAGEALTSRARGGRLCPLGMAVRTSRALDPCV